MNANELFEQAREAHLVEDSEKAGQLYEQVILDYPASEEADLSRAHLYNILHPTESRSQSLVQRSASVEQHKASLSLPFSSLVAYFICSGDRRSAQVC